MRQQPSAWAEPGTLRFLRCKFLDVFAGFWQLSGLNADSLHAASSAESAAYTAPVSSAGGAWDAFARPLTGDYAGQALPSVQEPPYLAILEPGNSSDAVMTSVSGCRLLSHCKQWSIGWRYS